LRYADVHRLKAALPHLIIEINGGFRTLEDAGQQLQHVDGVMIGRAAYDNPFLFAEADSTLFDQSNPVVDRHQVVEAMLPYIEEQLAGGVRLHSMTRHMLMLFRGQPGGRRWRRVLGESSVREGAGIEAVQRALAQVRRPGYVAPLPAS
jgi:tRNA-dihydrouridine synthase A